jgi:peptidoglycan pentaglycine glycine transferase (the first glycine)
MDVTISKEVRDPAWDSFLETQPDGLYQQSSLWANVKATSGWESLRFTIREDGQIIAGTQMFLKSLPIGGYVGYISKGPVIDPSYMHLQKFTFDQLDRIAKEHHIRFLKIQPAHEADAIVDLLLQRGALPSPILVTSAATIRVDIRPAPDEILAQMKSTTRYNIRYAERKGVKVYIGSREDIPTFCHLSKIHAEQHNYHPILERPLYGMWDVLAPDEHICLFFAEYEGNVVAARVNIAFGDVMLAKYLVDDGCHRKLNAPSLLHWKAMLWGKEHGYAWYDFAGIKPYIAKAIMEGVSIPDDSAGRRARFKSSFGGELYLRPSAYDLSFVWPRRFTVQFIPLMLRTKALLKFFIGGSLTNYVQMHHQAEASRPNLDNSEL